MNVIERFLLHLISDIKFSGIACETKYRKLSSIWKKYETIFIFDGFRLPPWFFCFMLDAIALVIHRVLSDYD